MTLFTHAFLREHRDDIVREWEALVEREPRTRQLTGAVLRSHIPPFLDELADWMERDEAPAGEGGWIAAAAIALAVQRLDRASQLTQLLNEVRLLRVTILRLLLRAESEAQARAGKEGMTRRVEELAKLNVGLDFALTNAVEYFVAERERRLVELADREATLARESDQRKCDFLAVLSHELRNPLAPIRNGLHILERVDARSEQAARAREVVGRQTRHLTRLVDDLLDVTRISRGKIELQRERFDLRDAVRATCDDLRSTFEQRGLDLRLEIPAGRVWIDGDPTRIAQILSNLLQNAARFATSAVNVRVATGPDEARVALEVRDDGAGMEPGVVEHVFEPFVQGPQGSAGKEGGLGLGLALVKGLVDLHGGSVVARSGGAGRGSEFVIELPLAPAPGPVVPAAEHGHRAAAPRLVLIIEDNPDAGDTLAQVLELAGHRTYIARDGRSGIVLALKIRPDVILCDIGLPDVDGYEVARALRANGDLPKTRLVALSGYTQPEDRRRATDAGFDAHLPKPPPLDELSELLARGP